MQCHYDAFNFFQIPHKTPHTLPMRLWYSDLHSASLTRVLYTIWCCIGPCYMGLRSLIPVPYASHSSARGCTLYTVTYPNTATESCLHTNMNTLYSSGMSLSLIAYFICTDNKMEFSKGYTIPIIKGKTNFTFTGSIGGCCFDRLLWKTWWKNWPLDNSWVTVLLKQCLSTSCVKLLAYG